MDIIPHRDSFMGYQMECVHMAIRKGSVKTLKALNKLYKIDMNDKSSYDEYFGTCLHVGIRYNQDNPEIIQTLIDYGAKVNETDYYGVSALYNAIDLYDSSIETIKMLLENGADIYNFGYINGGYVYESPLALALRKENYKVYEAMIPYTKGHKKWLTIRAVVRTCILLKRQYVQSVHNVWKPKGVGYFIAKAHFEHIACK